MKVWIMVLVTKEEKNNDLYKLNDVLFAELDRLSNLELKGEELENEIKRADAIVDISKQLIDNAELVLRAQIAKSQKMSYNQTMPKMLGG